METLKQLLLDGFHVQTYWDPVNECFRIVVAKHQGKYICMINERFPESCDLEKEVLKMVAEIELAILESKSIQDIFNV